MVHCQLGSAGTVVDLFSGCGGFSLGAELAGFHSLAAIDIEPNLQSAYRRNFPRTRAIQASVADIEASDWRRFLDRARPDGVIGGPPCQGFSWIGKKKNDDPRNSLIFQFFRHVGLLRPRFFIMENVEGLLHEDKVGVLNAAIDTLSAHYTVLKPLVVNAAHFGAPTARRRVVLVGFDSSDMDEIVAADLTPQTPHEAVTVRDAIADLPNPIREPSDRRSLGWGKYGALTNAELSAYAWRMRRSPPSGLGCQEAIEKHAAGYVSGVVRTRHSRDIARRYSLIHSGKSDPITKSVKLDWDGLCPTLRAGTGPEKGAFQAVRPLHPGRGRVITVREAARLQGFPDWFTFHPTKWHSFRMIGNSVSPIVGQAIFERLRSRLHQTLAA